MRNLKTLLLARPKSVRDFSSINWEMRQHLRSAYEQRLKDTGLRLQYIRALMAQARWLNTIVLRLQGRPYRFLSFVLRTLGLEKDLRHHFEKLLMLRDQMAGMKQMEEEISRQYNTLRAELGDEEGAKPVDAHAQEAGDPGSVVERAGLPSEDPADSSAGDVRTPGDLAARRLGN
jgi:hypothetical protein